MEVGSILIVYQMWVCWENEILEKNGCLKKGKKRKKKTWNWHNSTLGWLILLNRLHISPRCVHSLSLFLLLCLEIEEEMGRMEVWFLLLVLCRAMDVLVLAQGEGQDTGSFSSSCPLSARCYSIFLLAMESVCLDSSVGSAVFLHVCRGSSVSLFW